MKKILSGSIVLLFIIAANIFAQKMDGVEVTDAGSFQGSINGNDFNNMIRFGEAENMVSIATGDESFTLTINCKSVSTISEIKTGIYKLPSDKNVTVLYLDNNAALPCIITNGTLNITQNDEYLLKGTLEFTAAMGGIPKEIGGTEIKLTGGSFNISKLK